MRKILIAILLVAVNFAAIGQKKSKVNEVKKFSKKVTKTVSLNYLLTLPEGYSKDKSNYPLMIFLHGAGERGSDISKVKAWGIPKLIEEGRKFPCVVVSPQCPLGQYWSTDLMAETLIHFIENLEKKYNIDKSRIYLTGLSMGGYGSWKLAMDHPNKFAAVAPVCGDGNVANAKFLKNTPVWTFHGAKDMVVPISGTRAIVEKLQNAGGDVKFTIYPEVGHNSWENAYADQKLYDWMFSQKRK